MLAFERRSQGFKFAHNTGWEEADTNGTVGWDKL
jgi:hypothetical protein